MAINKVPFDTTTFTIQIHGLPPMFLHAGSAKLIGNRVGKVYEDSINRKAVVGHRFLRFKLDIEVRKPIPAGYFLSSHSDNENWIQFKYERLGDFCYKCGFLDHVTGRCDFEKPAFITSADGASARLYGPWLRAEHKGDLLFVNTPAEQEVAPVIGTGPKEGSFPSSESLIHRLEFALGCTDKTGEDDLQNAVETSQEFGALKLTLERKSSGDWPDIRAELINQVRISNNDPQIRAKWATRGLNNITLLNNKRKQGVNIGLLGEIGLGPAFTSGPTGCSSSGPGRENILRQKRGNFCNRASPSKRKRTLCIEEIHPIDQEAAAQPIDDSIIKEFVLGRGDQVESPCRSARNWKKQARRRSGRSDTRLAEASASSSATTRDFHMAEEAGHLKPPLASENYNLELQGSRQWGYG